MRQRIKIIFKDRATLGKAWGWVECWRIRQGSSDEGSLYTMHKTSLLIKMEWRLKGFK